MGDKKLSPKQKEKRDRILDAAIQLFAQSGYTGTKVADIAKAADVSFGTVFTYFESKEKLFEQTIREPLEKMNTVFYVREITDRPIIEQLENVVREQISFMAEQRGYLQLIQQVLGQPAKFPDLLAELDHYFEVMMDSVTPLIKKGQEEGVLYQDSPWILAASYISFLIGIRLTFTDHGLSDVWNVLVPQALKLFGPIRNGE
jgi:TetR/AcrR family transcriptional regulator, mexJK operon transcriptional repressor